MPPFALSHWKVKCMHGITIQTLPGRAKSGVFLFLAQPQGSRFCEVMSPSYTFVLGFWASKLVVDMKHASTGTSESPCHVSMPLHNRYLVQLVAPKISWFWKAGFFGFCTIIWKISPFALQKVFVLKLRIFARRTKKFSSKKLIAIKNESNLLWSG